MGLEKLIAKVLNKTRFAKYATYPAWGYVPTEFQEKLSADIGANKYSFSVSELGISIFQSLAALAFGESVRDIPYMKNIGIGSDIYALQNLATESLRAAYMLVARRPIGIFTLEIPYRLFKKSKRINRAIQKYLYQEKPKNSF